LRRRLGQGAWDSYRSRGTLNAKPADWCSAWLGAAIGIGSGPATREGSRPLS
jgi:hypothetical protein